MRISTEFISMVIIPLFFLGLILSGLLVNFTSNTFPFEKKYFVLHHFEEMDTDDFGNPIGENYNEGIYPVSRFEEIMNNDGANMSDIGFLFWQTGVAKGYKPIGITEYEKNKKGAEKLANYFSIGIVAFIEHLLVSLKFFMAGLLSFVIFSIYLKRRKLNKIFIPITLEKQSDLDFI